MKIHRNRLVTNVAITSIFSVLMACSTINKTSEVVAVQAPTGAKPIERELTEISKKASIEVRKIVMAGGSFWCMQPPFNELKNRGVISTQVGFTGGTMEKPTYDEVAKGKTGHFEVIEVTYDANKVSLDTILDTFWKNVDPYDNEGQFCDKGSQYTSAVFYNDDEEKSFIEASKLKAQENALEKGSVVTKILPFKEFYKAEEAHQEYYLKNPSKFKYYKYSCGRDDRLKKIWKKSSRKHTS